MCIRDSIDGGRQCGQLRKITTLPPQAGRIHLRLPRQCIYRAPGRKQTRQKSRTNRPTAAKQQRVHQRVTGRGNTRHSHALPSSAASTEAPSTPSTLSL